MSDDSPANLPAANAAQQERNARYGLILFALYFALYAGFIGMSVLIPRQMAAPALFGINLAIVYGFVLILAALVLALIYMALCARPLPMPTGSDASTAPRGEP